MYNILEKRIMDLFGVGFKDSFGILKDRHDCIMVYEKSGIDSQEMTCGEYLEMEYVIASLKKYCSSWVGRIFIVGSEPPERVKKDVIHIPCDNPYTHCKDANIIHKIRYMCENIADLSDDFLVISDDQIVTKKCSWEDMKQRIVRKYNDWTELRWEKYRKKYFWNDCLYRTLNLFSKSKSSFWEPHIWSPMNKNKFIEMCEKYNYKEDIGCIVFSLYYNFVEETPIKGYDHLHIDSKYKISSLAINELPRHLSWVDAAFKEKQFRDILDTVVGFNELLPTKTTNINKDLNNNGFDMIQKIREGIRNGTIIKEIKPDGTYIWKKIRK
jgi:hypothetical protein